MTLYRRLQIPSSTRSGGSTRARSGVSDCNPQVYSNHRGDSLTASYADTAPGNLRPLQRLVTARVGRQIKLLSGRRGLLVALGSGGCFPYGGLPPAPPSPSSPSAIRRRRLAGGPGRGRPAGALRRSPPKVVRLWGSFPGFHRPLFGADTARIGHGPIRRTRNELRSYNYETH